MVVATLLFGEVSLQRNANHRGRSLGIGSAHAPVAANWLGPHGTKIETNEPIRNATCFGKQFVVRFYSACVDLVRK
jgi:hypothetical protein